MRQEGSFLRHPVARAADGRPDPDGRGYGSFADIQLTI